jgi:3,4-dihydroxy 2-butanone 4-phosphate synthase
MKSVNEALYALKQGKFVLVHDFEDREDETDLLIAAELTTAKSVATMRSDAGGLICVAVDGTLAGRIGLPFMVDVYESAKEKFPLLPKVVLNDIRYDYKSAFSLTVNHRKTFTGIPDNDRALTISELGKFCRMIPADVATEFGKVFRSPGHVHLLISSDLSKRNGHTELSTALLKMAGLTPVAAICEMLDARTHEALKKPDAIKYAEKHGLIYLEGSEVKEAYENRNR